VVAGTEAVTVVADSVVAMVVVELAACSTARAAASPSSL
jgi:hypothetical protein